MNPKLDHFLAQRTRVVLLLLVLASTWVLTSGGLLSDDAVPFGDGEHYALRALSLYGFLHSGQWGQFWDELTSPSQSLLPLHYLVFFLVPSGLASVAVYGLIQVLVSCSLLALGAFCLCQALDRVTWSPALFLLCIMQNITLDASYFYFADTPFLAVVILSLAWQVRAWRCPAWQGSLLSGIGAALPFWVKPANALIFLTIYILAELARFITKEFDRREPLSLFRKMTPPYLRHWGVALAGILPMTLLPLACGGLQSIVYLIDANEASGLFGTHLECTGLLRLLYFPLCLTFFYQTGLILLIALGAVVILTWQRRQSAKQPAPAPCLEFPGHFLVPLLLAYGAFGLFFSFGMLEKEMRSLLILLPIFWLGVFWILDQWQVRPSHLFLIAAIYSVCASVQVTYGAFGGSSLNSGGYQLRDDWLSRFPPKHSTNPAGVGLTRSLLGIMKQSVPAGGKIAVGTEQMFLTSESLSWIEKRDSALLGKSPDYDFNNFLTNQGKYSRPALLGSRAILLILHPAFQYSPQVQAASAALAQFSYNHWMLEDHSAQVIPLMAQTDVILGVLIVPNQPLTNSLITQALTGTGGVELVDTLSFSGGQPRRLTYRECWDILLRWKAKRFSE